MKRREISYKELADALSAEAGGQTESVQSLINKVNRGRFSFAFFLRACRAMGLQSVDVSALPPVPESRIGRTCRSATSKVTR